MPAAAGNHPGHQPGTRRPATSPARVNCRAPTKDPISCQWYGDGTEIKTGEGKLYLASVLDMASRRVLGTRAQARARVSTWIQEYNRDRRHSALGMMSPVSYEQALQDTKAP